MPRKTLVDIVGNMRDRMATLWYPVQEHMQEAQDAQANRQQTSSEETKCWYLSPQESVRFWLMELKKSLRRWGK